MSWQAYVDTSLVGTQQVDKAAIINIAGDSTWASSPGFTIAGPEMKAISKIITLDPAAKDKPEGKEGSDAQDKAFAEGLYVAGERYVMARVEDGTIYARKGKEGVAMVKTTQAILIGHHGETGVAGNAMQAVQKLADYLVSLQY